MTVKRDARLKTHISWSEDGRGKTLCGQKKNPEAVDLAQNGDEATCGTCKRILAQMEEEDD